MRNRENNSEEDLDETPLVNQVAPYTKELSCWEIYDVIHAITLLIAGEGKLSSFVHLTL